MRRTTILALCAGMAMAGCAGQSGKPTFEPALASLGKCPKGTVRYCDRRSQLPCECISQRSVNNVKNLFR